MRRGIKAAIMAAFAGPAIAALMLTGAGPANAAVTASTAPHISSGPYFGYCSPSNLERYDFRGYNTVDLNWNGTSYKYAVHFNQQGSCLSGWLTDTNIPVGDQTMPIHGYVFRNHVTFSVTYTYPGAPQGTRVYTGNIGYFGYVSGTWYDTGDHASGSWHLAHAVRMACPQFFPWFGFFQHGNGCPVPFPYHFYY
jgi:hypothetical protein